MFVFVAIEMDELVLLVADSVVAAYHVDGGIIIIMVVEVLAPILRHGAVEQRNERCPHHIFRFLHAGDVEVGRCVVDILYQRRAFAVRLGFPRVADDERRAHRFFIHETLVEPSVLAHIESLVGGIDDDGIVHQVVFLQIVEQAAHFIVHRLDAAQVIAQICLIFPADKVFARRLLFLEVFRAFGVCFVPRLALFGVHALQSPFEVAQPGFVLIGFEVFQPLHL